MKPNSVKKQKKLQNFGVEWGNCIPSPTPISLITSRVTSWAGGTDKLQRREPLSMHIKSLSELSTAGTNAACIQAVHDIPS